MSIERWSCYECGWGFLGEDPKCPVCKTEQSHPVSHAILGRMEDPDDDDAPVRLDRGARVQLPCRRPGHTDKLLFTDGNWTVYLRSGEYPDGSLGEIFLDCKQEGSTFRGLLGCFAIAISIALQYGVPLEEFVEAFVGRRFPPMGKVKGHEDIKFAHSMMDLIFRDLGIEYLKMEKLKETHDADAL